MTAKEKIDKKEHLLNVAERVFGELGYDGASTRLLAQEAGVNMAMLNYYFGSKDGLLMAVVERRMGHMKKGFEEIAQQDTSSWEKIIQIVQLYVIRVATSKYFHKIIFREISVLRSGSELTDFVLDNLYRNVMLVHQILEEGIQKSEFRPVDIEMTVVSIFGTVNYIINSRRLASKILNMDLLDDQVLQDEMKPRLLAYLQDSLKTHLLIK
ncbi:TetR/AcrR family transcriptional regulator [Rufibacter latericius]|uniref:TetR/AcrR family transcriptional regulator n=1 Tax=Rufibacter latericius TaxID=2487040 RepID=A0A3M9MA02_9BACT|nr:TetR/AcrR family transcriptional regulator [Rufibacter latericius]RNI22384.1 TetR/AcrR family transcriptional regulator [Rufibacter latericius]